TAFAVSNDEGRFTLNAVLFVANGNRIRMVATDSFRLALVEGQVEGLNVSEELRILIPKEAARSNSRLAEAGRAYGDCQRRTAPLLYPGRAHAGLPRWPTDSRTKSILPRNDPVRTSPNGGRCSGEIQEPVPPCGRGTFPTFHLS